MKSRLMISSDTKRRLASVLAALICCLIGYAAAQTIPRDLKTWTLEYRVVGGVAGLDQRLRLTDDGELSVGSPHGRGTYVITHASPELMTKAAQFLQAARILPPLPPDVIPDRIYASLSLTSGGASYSLALTAEMAKLFSNAMGAVVKQALLGTWWESGWNLCSPATRLTTADVDVPIERLVFENGGRFSVTWRGGGARGYLGGKLPHVEIPDYSGRYSIVSSSYIRMTFESGIFTPRDFSGEGYFQIKGNKLDLRNIWLGTKRAERKPDICELEFTRTSEPTRSSAPEYRSH